MPSLIVFFGVSFFLALLLKTSSSILLAPNEQKQLEWEKNLIMFYMVLFHVSPWGHGSCPFCSLANTMWAGAQYRLVCNCTADRVQMLPGSIPRSIPPSGDASQSLSNCLCPSSLPAQMGHSPLSWTLLVWACSRWGSLRPAFALPLLFGWEFELDKSLWRKIVKDQLLPKGPKGWGTLP